MGPMMYPSAEEVGAFLAVAFLLFFGSGFALGRCTADLHPHVSISLH